MKTGLLWFDDDPNRRLEEKVSRAAQHYERKFGYPPTLCFAHPSALESNGGCPLKQVGSVEIRSDRPVLRNHFWLGAGDETDFSIAMNGDS